MVVREKFAGALTETLKSLLDLKEVPNDFQAVHKG